MPETSFHATLTRAAARASLPSNSCHPLSAWQRRRVRFAINLSHLTADRAGCSPSTPLCCRVPGRDVHQALVRMSLKYGQGGKKQYKIEAPGCNISCVSGPGLRELERKLELGLKPTGVHRLYHLRLESRSEGH